MGNLGLQVLLMKVAETKLADHVRAVRASGVQLASSMDSLIGEKLAFAVLTPRPLQG